jgi:membrane protease YdiL (CAAX protease family)
LRGLLNRHRPAVAVGLSAFLFAVLHLNPWQFISPLLLGIAFGWLYLRTGSVGLCVFAHAFSNSLAIAVTELRMGIQGLASPSEAAAPEFQPPWLDLSGVVLLLVGLWVFRTATPPAKVYTGPAPPVIDGVNTQT